MKVKFLIECNMDESCDSGSPYDFVDRLRDWGGRDRGGVEILKVRYRYPKGASPDQWTEIGTFSTYTEVVNGKELTLTKEVMYDDAKSNRKKLPQRP